MASGFRTKMLRSTSLTGSVAGLQLVDRAAEIRLGRRGRAVADGVDPQDAVVPRQEAHEVRLRERIAGQVVAEAEHVLTPEGVGGNVAADGRAFGVRGLHV